MSDRHLDFWYEFGSNYSYLSVMRIEPLARAAGVTINWRPFLLGPIFRQLGMATSPFVLQKEKGAYVWLDMQRRARKYGLPFQRPSQFPRSALLPARVAALGSNETWIAEFSRRIMRGNWVDDRDIDNEQMVLEALHGLVPEPASLLALAREDHAKDLLREQTAEARKLGIFGAPVFFVNGDMYWGDDRLEDALEALAP